MVSETGDVVVDHMHGSPISRTDHQRDVDVFTVPAHCVFIASRCDWFRRALLSGMRESIDKWETELPFCNYILGGIETRTKWLEILQTLFSKAFLAAWQDRIVLYFRKITVHDTNPELFKLFLGYLYSGQLDASSLSTEQLADMMAVADRYEVSGVLGGCRMVCMADQGGVSKTLTSS